MFRFRDAFQVYVGFVANEFYGFVWCFCKGEVSLCSEVYFHVLVNKNDGFLSIGFEFTE